MSTIASRWKVRKAIRATLLVTARTALRSRKTKENLARVQERKAQVAQAERVIRRHPDAILREKALYQARAALARHVFETGGNNRGPEVEEIIHYAGGDVGEPWCVDFVIWCYGKAGSRVLKPGFPRAVSMMRTMGVTTVANPMPGDAVRYRFGQGHTGIFECWVRLVNGEWKACLRRDATALQAIEGNTGATGAVSDGNGSDGVYRKIRTFDQVLDYLHVKQ